MHRTCLLPDVPTRQRASTHRRRNWTTALAPRLRVFRSQHALASCGRKYKFLRTTWGIRGSQPSTCSTQHATPDTDASAPGNQIKGQNKLTRLRCDRGSRWDNSLCPGCQRWHRECGSTTSQMGWPIRWSGGHARSGGSDGARGLLLVPTNFKAGYFIALRAVAVPVLELETHQSLYRLTRKPLPAA